MSKMTLLAALAALDVLNDNHWTGEGSPRLDVVKFMTGNAGITREQVTQAAPGLSRANPLQAVAQAAPQGGAGEGGATGTDSGAPAGAQVASQGDGNGDAGGDDTGAGDRAAEVAASQGATAGEDQGPRDALEEAQDHLEFWQRRFELAQKEVQAARTAVDREIEARDAARVGTTASDAVADYHASQRRLLKERGDRIEALKGVSLKDILPKRAPIDEAMRRKTARGGQRPKTLG